MSVTLKDYKGNVVDIGNQSNTLIGCIVGNDNGHKIPFVGHDAQESTLLKFNDHIYLYYTKGEYINNVRYESVVVAEYNPETNTLVSDINIVANSSIFEINANIYKCSFFWVEGQYIYGIVSLWNGTLDSSDYINKCIMIKSSDALHFTLVSNNIVDNLFPPKFPNRWYGNHCVIKVSDSKWYWYIEIMTDVFWETYLIQSNSIESGWQLVGKCNIDSTPVGGVRGYLDNDKIKILFHYGGLPTRLGYAEAEIKTPTIF